MRVNLGCGQAYMEGWVNVDESPDVKADVYLDAAEFVRRHGAEVDEVYMGHVLEHLMPGDALVTLRLMNERLRPGAVVSAVTPDMSAIFRSYLAGELTNEDLNAKYVYSYVQPSHHIWCYDQESLLDLFRRAGYADAEPVDPLTWPPVMHKEGLESQWQCGVKATAAGRPVPVADDLAEAARELEALRDEEPSPSTAERPVTVEAVLAARAERLRRRLVEEVRRRRDLEAQLAAAGPEPQTDLEAGADPATTPTDVSRAPAHVPSSAEEPPATVRSRVRRKVAGTLPEGTRRRQVAKAGLYSYREAVEFGRRVRYVWAATGALEPGEPSYEKWSRQHDASDADLAAQREAAAELADPTRFLVLVRAGADAAGAAATAESLAAQSWGHWSAVLLGTGELGVAAHPRLVQRTALGEEWVAAANDEVSRTDAHFVLFLEAGDRLAPDCLYHLSVVDRQDPLLDVVYWDDDLLDERGDRREPRFRPAWSPEVLLGADYVGRSFAVRTRRLLWADGLRPGYGEATTWDLLLRAGLDGQRATRLPRVLGHVRSRPDVAGEGGRRAVQAYLDRAGLPARATLSGAVVHVEWERTEWPHVTVVVPTRHNRPMLARLLPGLARTDYPSFDVVVVDNGGRSPDNEQWYVDHAAGLQLTVDWWTAPFNYSAVNNHGARLAKGDVLVFLNDDTEAVDASWLRELVGWALHPEVGTAGLQLVGPDGELQHAGAVLGLGGFADHVFQGLRPDSPTLIGPTGWYRDVLAVTGACLAVRREVFDRVGGFDERFVLCGSDVALGLDTHLVGLRNVCSPFGRVRHLESATRGPHVPPEDFYASYWRYQSYVIGGDPYFSPSLSLGSRTPRLRSPYEPTPAQRMSVALGRNLRVFRQRSSEDEARMLADLCRADAGLVDGVRLLHEQHAGRLDVRTVNWFIPDIDSPFYGGINTALRMADYLAREHGVENRFVVWGAGPEPFIRSALAAAFPSLADAPMLFYDGDFTSSLLDVPECDVAIATLWVTAYAVAHAPGAKRKFYLVQDFEPMFYPAGTLYALTEETYRLGLYGLCNTDNLLRIYTEDYGGRGRAFVPAVDPTVFHARGRVEHLEEDRPATVFVYARPGHWRNCWELASLALDELKHRVGRGVRIVTAGSWALPERDSGLVKHLGLLDYRATGELYRTCDVGLALTVSKHPSYLPLELMACGVPVVAFDNPWGHWVLRDGENCLLAPRTVDGLADALERLVVDPELRRRMSKNALATIAAGHADWDTAFAGVYDALCDPEGTAPKRRRPPPRKQPRK